MAVFRLMMGLRFIDALRLEDLEVREDKGGVLRGSVWLNTEKNNVKKERKKLIWAAVDLQRDVIVRWLRGRSVVPGCLFETDFDRRKEKDAYDRYAAQLRSLGAISSHSFKRTHHRRIAMTMPNIPDEELKWYTGHKSVEAMCVHLGPELREFRHREASRKHRLQHRGCWNRRRKPRAA